MQRVPVRIALEPKDLKDHPLRLGLSVSVQADVRDQSGPLVSTAPPTVMRSEGGEDGTAEVDALIARILAANREPGR